MSDDSSKSLQEPTLSVLLCDRCHRRPAVGYTEGFEYPDSANVYCRACADGMEGLILFDQGS